MASHNLVAVAEVEGPLCREDLCKALDALQERTPMLGVRIRREANRLVFCGDQVPAVPLQIKDAPKASWCAHAERELNTGVSVETGPLARCTVLRHGGSRSTILFTFLHAICDGQAAFFVVRDFVRLLAGFAGSDPTREGKGGEPFCPSLYAALPGEVKGLRGSLRLGMMMGREMIGYLREGGVPKRLPLDSRPPCFLRWTRIVPVRLNLEETERLVRRAKRESASVHSAVCAAGLLAVCSEVTDGRPRVLACTSAVDMRTRVAPPLGEQLGMFVSVLWVGQRVWQGQPFWDLARQVREKFAGRIARGDPAVVAGGGSLLLPLMERLPGKNRSRRIVMTAEKMMYNFKGTGVSSVGKLEMPAGEGTLSLRSLSFAGSLVNLGYFLAVVNTFNGRLHINYLVNDPLLTRSRASGLLQTAERLLRASVE